MANKPVITDQQLKFIVAYIIQPKAKEAALAAGYSPKTANNQGLRLLKKDVIRAEIARRSAPAVVKQEITINRILLENARIAFRDPRQLYREDGTMLPPKEWPDEIAAAISSIETEEHYEPDGKGEKVIRVLVHRVRFAEKGPALDRFFKYKRLYAPDAPQNPGVTNLIQNNFNFGALNAEQRAQFTRLLEIARSEPDRRDVAGFREA